MPRLRGRTLLVSTSLLIGTHASPPVIAARRPPVTAIQYGRLAADAPPPADLLVDEPAGYREFTKFAIRNGLLYYYDTEFWLTFPGWSGGIMVHVGTSMDRLEKLWYVGTRDGRRFDPERPGLIITAPDSVVRDFVARSKATCARILAELAELGE